MYMRKSFDRKDFPSYNITIICLLVIRRSGIIGSKECKNSTPLAMSMANLNAWF